jgi:hypothetical protein
LLRAASSQALHLVVEAALGVLGAVVLGAVLLGWRLSQGPIDITWLAQREAYRLVAPGAQLAIGHAALAWEGFVDPGSAIDIRWQDITVTAQDGARLGRLPGGRVSLAPAPLLVGQIAPRAIEIDGPRLSLLRRADGSIALDVGTEGGAGTGVGKGPGGQRLLADLTGSGSGPTLPFLSQLAALHVRAAVIGVRDEALGALWQARAATIDLQRQAGGGISGQAVLALQAGQAQASLSAQAELTISGTHITAQTTPISPAVLARALPSFAPGAALDAPLQGSLEADLAPDFSLRHARLAVQVGAGTLAAGRGSVALSDASVVLVAHDAHTVELASLRIAPKAVAGAHLPAPVITGHGSAAVAGGRVRADFAIDLDRVDFADLPAYWPPGTGAGARPWITGNISAGTAQNGHITGAIVAGADGSDLTLTALGGGIDARDLTFSWLKPVPGLTHANGHVTLQGPDALLIDMTQARQLVPGGSGTLAVSQGRMEITGLMAKDQIGQIDLAIGGELADVLALLNHPRLHLLSRRPVAMRDPAGRAAITLSVRLPLDDRVTMDDIAIKARATLTDVHLGGIVAGRDLDHGALDMTVDGDALNVAGTADVAAIPARVGVTMDFRNGPPDQMLEHYTAKGVATPAAMVAAGLPVGVLTAGSAGVDVDYTERRNGSGAAAIDLDLGAATIATPLGWSKAAGPAASASARLGLTGGRITSLDRLSAEGPGLSIASHAQIRAGQGTVLVLDRVRMGRSTAHGTIGLPHGAGDKLRVMLRGPALDISALLAHPNGGARPQDAVRAESRAEAKPGARWLADLAFDRVILARDEALSDVSLQAESDGLHIAHAALRAGGVEGGANGAVSATIVPVPGGRRMSVDSADSGAVLLAAGIADNIRGGKLRVDGFYDDRQPHSPLRGTANLSGFRITDAPAVGRLLKAATLYGAIDLLRGPGLGFAQAVVPFTYVQQVLSVDGARAYSASLGVTAKGSIDLLARRADVTGTVVPAYFFNQLPGLIPVVGRLFSPEKGGGLFAAQYSVRGPLSDPKIGVNALSALTPGFLRGVFGLFSKPGK